MSANGNGNRRNVKRILSRSEMQDVEPILRIAFAVLAQAVQDAGSGDDSLSADAIDWLAREGRYWAELLGTHPAQMDDWLERLVLAV